MGPGIEFGMCRLPKIVDIPMAVYSLWDSRIVVFPHSSNSQIPIGNKCPHCGALETLIHVLLDFMTQIISLRTRDMLTNFA